MEGRGTEQDKMKGRLDRQIAKTRASLFDLLLSGGAVPHNIHRLNADYSYQLRSGTFRIGLLKIDGDYDTLYTEGLLSLRNKASELLHEKMQPLCYDHEIVFEQTTGKMLLNYPGGNRKKVHACLQDVLETMELRGRFYAGTECTAALGSEEELPTGLQHSALVADISLAQRLFGLSGTLIEPMFLVIHTKEGRDLLASFLPRAEKALRKKEAQTLAEVVDAFAEQVSRTPQLNGKDILWMAEEWICFVMMFCERAGVEPSDLQAMYEEYAQRVDLCSTKGGVFDVLKQHICRSIDIL